MSYNFSFADNAVYSAADVNKITSRLVTAGVEDPFTDGVPYNLSAINEAGTLVYTEGVVPETVNTLKVTRGTEEGAVLINPGTAFFADGSVIEVESGGETLSYTAGMKHYVYLKNDLVNTNTSYPVCSAEEPVGDFVLLAEVAEDGVITDKRTYARGKLPGYASSAQCVMKITDRVAVKSDKPETSKSYQIGDNNYKFLLVINDGTEAEDQRLLGLYCFEDDSYLSFSVHSASKNCDSTSLLYMWHGHEKYLTAEVALFDGVLTLSFSFRNTLSSYFTDNLPITLYLF